MTSRRNSDSVVVSGMGMVTPLGVNAPESWARLLDGATAGEWLTDTSWTRPFEQPPRPWAGCPVAIPRAAHIASRLVQLSQLAVREAVETAGGIDHVPPERRACVIGTSKIDLASLDAPNPVEAMFRPNDPAVQIAQEFDCQAAALCPVAACATGTVSLLRAAQLIRQGAADLVIAGSVDASLHPALLASYDRLGVMARPLGQPNQACRPFDEDRSGFLVGEGAAAFILERADCAETHSKKVQILGGSMAADPSGMTLVDSTGSRLAHLIRLALEQCQVLPNEIDAVSLHGTATRMNDLAESRGLKLVFGRKLPEMPAFATKGATGHLMGAAGSVESAFAVMSLQQQVLPPTSNLRQQDPECKLLLTQEAQSAQLQTVLKLSLGFGGHMAAVVIRS
ncbi:MAG: beta-ketoacyl-[acyl-carrier-protein] synthase family protein [Planctomycetaceae bacterium]|nr:beta-ketoacyl-[acyl-carrier-protein] synthase family protein [Planctomycetaceae bacterium]